MDNFKEFQLTPEEAMNVTGEGLKRKKRKKLKELLSSNPLNYEFQISQNEDGSISETRVPRWKGYEGGIKQYYKDNYTDGSYNGFL